MNDGPNEIYSELWAPPPRGPGRALFHLALLSDMNPVPAFVGDRNEWVPA